MPKTFYRVYRPQKFNELVGQELIRLTLSQAVKENRIAHAYLFTGPRGTGKTTTARIFAKAVNCLTSLEERIDAEPCDKCQNCLILNSNKTVDLTEIDAASYTGVDNIRQLTENINLSPAELRFRIFIIDEVHMLSRGAFNALLKTLEEPPSHTIFILATTEQSKIPLTIASRCQRFSFRLLSLPEIFRKLSRIAEKEKIDVDKDSLELIGEASQGGMRDAESLFAQIVSLAGEKITVSETKEILGIAGRDSEIKFLDHLFEKETGKALADLKQMVDNGIDVFQLTHRLLDYLRKILYLKVNPGKTKMMEKEISASQINKLKKLAGYCSVAELIDLTGKMIHVQPAVKSSSVPNLPLELVIIEWGMGTIQKSPSQITQEVPEKSQENNSNSPDSDETIKSNDLAEPPNSVRNTGELALEITKSDVPPVSDKKIAEKTAKISAKEKKAKKEKGIPVDLKAVLVKWTTVLQNVRELQPALFSLLKVCSPVKIEDDALVISTPFKFHKDKLSDGKNRAVFCQELNKEVGIKRICVVQDSSLPQNKTDDDAMLDQVKSLLG